MRYLLVCFFILIFLPSCSKDVVLPLGFEYVSRDGNSHFLYLHEKFIGDKIEQRKTGRLICTELFEKQDYCEVYYFSERDEVPKKFPIMNRIRPIGVYQFKNGKEIFKGLGR